MAKIIQLQKETSEYLNLPFKAEELCINFYYLKYQILHNCSENSNKIHFYLKILKK